MAYAVLVSPVRSLFSHLSLLITLFRGYSHSTNPSDEAFRERPWRAISSLIGAYRDGSVEVAVGFLPYSQSR